MLEGKKILLGVCGSIASYKAAVLVRLLVKTGANVKVIMTKDAANFITPLTLSTLSKNPVLTDYFIPSTGEWNNHVDLGIWADLMLVAPASANTLAKFANGICDNLLSACYLSARCPVFFAPAMDLDMWKHPSTQRNVSALESYGNTMIRPVYGELASGLVGEGRMSEPEEIVQFLRETIQEKLPLRDKVALVTAGPTHEAIDPVRFIGNHSSGKMGFAIAEQLAKLGAQVTLVAGPTTLSVSQPGIRRINVTSAEDMFKACTSHFAEAHITVMSAAVADYRPESIADQKIKKNSAAMAIDLVKTVDILAELGKQKRPEQLLVGFALETQNEESNAVDKLKRKNLDFIVLNSLNDKGAGFKGEFNKVTIIDRSLQKDEFGLKTKSQVAEDICIKIVDLISQ
jgi:phosphopantothenoylcysteine decarboxylase / phosphopantothenate---cysteine ligase